MQADLVRRAQRGDEEAFAALVPAAVDRLIAVAYRILRDPQLAEDATQQALLPAVPVNACRTAGETKG